MCGLLPPILTGSADYETKMLRLLVDLGIPTALGLAPGPRSQSLATGTVWTFLTSPSINNARAFRYLYIAPSSLRYLPDRDPEILVLSLSSPTTTFESLPKMPGGKGKSIGGKGGSKDAAGKAQKSHSAKAGLQVSCSAGQEVLGAGGRTCDRGQAGRRW